MFAKHRTSLDLQYIILLLTNLVEQNSDKVFVLFYLYNSHNYFDKDLCNSIENNFEEIDKDNEHYIFIRK